MIVSSSANGELRSIVIAQVGLRVQHLLAKLREVLNSLLTLLCLKIQEVHNAEVDVVFDNPV